MIDLIYAFVTLHPIISLSILGIISLIVGSFLNVVIYRLPIMLIAQWRSESMELLHVTQDSHQPDLNLSFPRSHCQFCKHTIPAWHNIPIISFIFLRGKCSVCQHSIAWRYPLIELLSLSLALLAGYYFGFSLNLLFALPFLWLLLCLSAIDIQHQLLPDSLTLGLLWLGLIANTQNLFTTLPDAVLTAAGAYASLWLFIKLVYLLTGKVGMGHGDFKLFAALGAWFGWNSLLFILLVSSILGTIIGVIYLYLTGKNRETPIPFGPFLCIAGASYLFFTMLK